MHHALAQPARPRRVLYTLADGQQVSALLRTPLLHELTRADDIQWVFLSPLAERAEFRQQLAHPRVELHPLPTARRGLLARQLEFQRRELTIQRLDARSVQILYRRAAVVEPNRYYLHRPLARLLGRLPGIESWLDTLQDWVGKDAALDAALDALQVDCVLLGSGAVKMSDVPVGRWARRRGLPLFGVIPSWDNLAIKAPSLRCDAITVWNDIMRAQARTLFGYRPEQIAVTGPTGFDVYTRGAPRLGREEFLTRLGLSPGRRLITYTTMPPFTANFSAQFVHTVADWIARDAFVQPAQLLVRLHPQDDPGLYRGCEGLPHVVLERPGRYRADAHFMQAIVYYDPSEEDVAHLRDTLWHSDVVMNIASTITLEACALDRPVVNLAYNPAGSRWPVSIFRYYSLEHYKPVTRSGAVRLAKSPEDLLAALNEALLHPEYRRAERRELYRRMVTYLDGRCAERQAAAILDFVCATGAASALAKAA